MQELPLDDKWEQLAHLSGLTKTTGVLHEAQVLQLKYWPYVMAPHAKSIETVVFQEKKEVRFVLKLGKKAPPSDFQARLDALDRSVKTMLGYDWQVVVQEDRKPCKTNKTIFRSKSHDSNPRISQNRTDSK